ncbi:protein kinase domain-containing protein [Citrus sinensis]|uniref:Protein kinase domain-containing protein n=1 Tax=Citrus sinensis TaxID=2711 RepID=A0ACB8LSR9_CITSI|nr:protein kinase domain-containing protein [Citrus sinensis]
MDRRSIWALPVLVFLLFPVVKSEVEEEVKRALVQFMEKLSVGNAARDPNWGWNRSSDPCSGKWVGVTCDSRQKSVRKIVLDGFNLSGILDTTSVCKTQSLVVLSLEENNIAGTVSQEISNCKQLTHLYVGRNKLSGNLPDSLSKLNNLKRLDISNNNFSSELPDLSRISGLLTFFAENNQLRGGIPEFDFSNLLHFNVSNNNLSGPVPGVNGRLGADSFSGNPGLCGKPLPNACPPTPPPIKESKGSSTNQVFLFSGYILLGLFILLLIALKLVSKNKQKEEKTDVIKKEVALDTNSNKRSSTSSGHRAGDNRSEYSITSVDSGAASSSLVVLTSSKVNKLKFEDLLRAPAELLGRGKHGSLYRVVLDDGLMLAVKRLRDWSISSEDFKNRMQKIDHVKHPNVLPPLAYYCSKQEKLLVYEYQPNGSLFNLLHGSENGQSFDWGSRLRVAACVAKALGLIHEELGEDGIAHGNLKSNNILFNNNMEPCISEYGLIVTENQDQSSLAQTSSLKINDISNQMCSTIKADVYAFGVILLELLTGKLVQNNGFNLATWVHSVVREEWTVEVLDEVLIAEAASEERMLKLLQVALKCINQSPNERPSMNQVAVMINNIKEEEERSISSEAR